MNRITRPLLVVCAFMVAEVLAADQNAPAAGQPPAQSSAGTAPAQVSAPSATNSGKKVLVDDSLNDAQLKQILARGYKPTSQARGNEVLYCRSERETGSRFDKRVCKTATRITQDELNGKEATTRLEQTSGNHRGN